MHRLLSKTKSVSICAPWFVLKWDCAHVFEVVSTFVWSHTCAVERAQNMFGWVTASSLTKVLPQCGLFGLLVLKRGRQSSTWDEDIADDKHHSPSLLTDLLQKCTQAYPLWPVRLADFMLSYVSFFWLQSRLSQRSLLETYAGRTWKTNLAKCSTTHLKWSPTKHTWLSRHNALITYFLAFACLPSPPFTTV